MKRRIHHQNGGRPPSCCKIEKDSSLDVRLRADQLRSNLRIGLSRDFHVPGCAGFRCSVELNGSENQRTDPQHGRGSSSAFVMRSNRFSFLASGAQLSSSVRKTTVSFLASGAQTALRVIRTFVIALGSSAQVSALLLRISRLLIASASQASSLVRLIGVPALANSSTTGILVHLPNKYLVRGVSLTKSMMFAMTRAFLSSISVPATAHKLLKETYEATAATATFFHKTFFFVAVLSQHPTLLSVKQIAVPLLSAVSRVASLVKHLTLTTFQATTSPAARLVKMTTLPLLSARNASGLMIWRLSRALASAISTATSLKRVTSHHIHALGANSVRLVKAITYSLFSARPAQGSLVKRTSMATVASGHASGLIVRTSRLVLLASGAASAIRKITSLVIIAAHAQASALLATVRHYRPCLHGEAGLRLRPGSSRPFTRSLVLASERSQGRRPFRDDAGAGGHSSRHRHGLAHPRPGSQGIGLSVRFGGQAHPHGADGTGPGFRLDQAPVGQGFHRQRSRPGDPGKAGQPDPVLGNRRPGKCWCHSGLRSFWRSAEPRPSSVRSWR